MADINDLRNIVNGGEVAILGNGPSLLDQVPILGDVDTIGINASLQYHKSRWHCALDQETLVQLPEMKYEADILFTTNLPYKLPKINTEQISIPTRHHDYSWSNDLNDCIYSGKATIWFASQVAVWLGYEDIYLMGFDLSGKRPSGHLRSMEDIPNSSISRQLQLMGYLRGLIDTGEVKANFYNCTYNSSCNILPKVKWENRLFTKQGAYGPALDVDISITRRKSKIGGGICVKSPE